VREVIRGSIGFDGMLMTDDISMEALAEPMRARCRASLAAGCDVVLHCNGRFDEMCEVAEEAPPLAGAAARRAAAALAWRRPGPEIDVAEARRRFAAMMAPVRADEAVRT
jgi:beta-N-acetylhexosaminidase